MQIRLCLPVWLTDKARAEKAAIKEVIPDCDQFLCSFHVLQSFRRELNLANVEKGERERILQVLQQLVFANSETEYMALREDVTTSCHTYLKDNWDGIRGEWVSRQTSDKQICLGQPCLVSSSTTA
ncbi:hypothetical protein FJT64_024504 [Amphibalanus amphitrite]|uniref:MULE transposase domain-containing protein n=1 Tax=Amphibalanus amphitrite TaxID=1232801 RepID=A0A6A4WI45_AMPAM|nr:hypothetical protein FJT64_024504 [Amphibalanus amphitrite]